MKYYTIPTTNRKANFFYFTKWVHGYMLYYKNY